MSTQLINVGFLPLNQFEAILEWMVCIEPAVHVVFCDWLSVVGWVRCYLCSSLQLG